MKRTKLSNRCLPDYTRGEEIMNMVTHIAGGGLAVFGSIFCILKAWHLEWADLIGAVIYCVSMIGVYTMSSVYHGLRTDTSKKVMQVIDHCAIYFLIAGTYTPIMITGFLPVFPKIGWGLLTMQWALAALAVTLTAIDLKKYKVFSMVCYIFMGWGIIFFLPQAMIAMTKPGFYWLLAGGIAYTIGAVLFGLGKKLRWMHGVFHIFVILGSLFQYLAIVLNLY
jgi:hemolysin III